MALILDLRLGGGRRRRFGFSRRARAGAFGLGAQTRTRALGDARALAGATAQIIQLGAAHHPAAHHLDRGDARGIERKDALHPLAVGDLAQGEVRVDAGVLARDAYPFEGLDALALALDDPDHDPDRVAGLKFRHGPGRGELFDLLALDLLQQIHRSTPRSRRGRAAAPPGNAATNRDGARGSGAPPRPGATPGSADGRPRPAPPAPHAPAKAGASCTAEIRGGPLQSSPRRAPRPVR